MGRLSGRVAWITGGARGQGRAMAIKFAAEGADIVITDRCADLEAIPYELSHEDELIATRERVLALGRGCVALVGDVRSLEDMERSVAAGLAEFGKIDILCANAGVHSFTPLWEMPAVEWQQVIDVNLTGVWNAARAVAAPMMERQSGVIIATSSVMGRETGKDLSHYTASKHGVLGLVKSLAYELGPHGVRANALLPSVVHDKMGDNPPTRRWIFGREASTEEYVEASRHWHGLRGVAALPAAAIADAALWLASDEARYVSGAEILVDGAHSAVPPYNHEPVHAEDVAVGPYPDDGIVVADATVAGRQA
jgi:SDR family mycofactocin-dependent oxidoreductase